MTMAEINTGTVNANGINFHYLEMGEGPLALCFHGFPDHAWSFRHLLPDLADAGFRAVAPFMRGYAPTEPPADGRYQQVALCKDVLALIGALGAERAYLIGNDWGAGAVTGATVLEPEKVMKLVIIASGQVDRDLQMNYQYLKGTWHSYFFQLPQAEQALAYNDFAFVEEWWRDASPEWDIPASALESIRETFRKPGVVDAALGYYRARYSPALQDSSMREDQDRVNAGPVTVPTLALHGTRDRPRRLDAFESEAMDRFFTGGLEKVIIPGTGHFMHQEKPAEVNPKIVEFLTR
jgi:pimeloyl-ACP methyl ester carboxylesterase